MNAATVPVLAIDDLVVEIGGNRIVDHVSLSVGSGRILAIVGESGCGKSLTALSVLGLLPKAARVVGGEIRLNGRDLLPLGENALSEVRGNEATIIFQEPVASLNPLMRVGEQVEEALRLHRGLSASAAREEAIAMMTRVGIPDASRRARQYPFELSGGMCQRIMIASALICRPALLIADEPTTALDVTIQAQVLDLLVALQRQQNMALILITHDLALLAEHAKRIAVMYAGEVVEVQSVPRLFEAPHHPYTEALLAAIPEHSRGARRLPTLAGLVPGQHDRPRGCMLSPRCPHVIESCRSIHPGLDKQPDGGLARCIKPLNRQDSVAAVALGGTP